MNEAEMRGRKACSLGLDMNESNPFCPYNQNHLWVAFQEGYLKAANHQRILCGLPLLKNVFDLQDVLMKEITQE